MRIRYLCLGFSLAMAMMFSGSAFAWEGTSVSDIGQISVNDYQGAGGSTYYIKTTDGDWDVAACPNTTWAYFWSSETGAAAFHSTALAAMLSGKQVQIYGICTHTGYIYVEQLRIFE